ncbi:MAG: hypothetical protein RMJ56_09195 [Gemmataceae bacterium]|nr:hypothetical protein [Gemmata sp.]MDW8197763.1 hypothetical protein [Gemmataceae bacterium]
MSVAYTCPNPDCGVTLRTANRVAPGKSVKCPKCGKIFTPEAAESPGDTLRLAEEPAKAAAATGNSSSVPPPVKKPFADDDDESDESIRRGYGVIKETEQDQAEAAKNKPSFTEIQDKFKRSARGPAMSLLVMPANLLTGAGLLTCAGGLFVFVQGMWPLVFNDAPPGEEELEEAIVGMMLGVCTFFWGAMVCFGASQMQELASYPWAMIGSIMGIPLLLIGVYCLVMLQNPKVKAGFAESEGGPDDDEDEEPQQRSQAEDEDDDDDDTVSARRARQRRRQDDDEDDEDDDDTPPRRSRHRRRQDEDDE